MGSRTPNKRPLGLSISRAFLGFAAFYFCAYTIAVATGALATSSPRPFVWFVGQTLVTVGFAALFVGELAILSPKLLAPFLALIGIGMLLTAFGLTTGHEPWLSAFYWVASAIAIGSSVATGRSVRRRSRTFTRTWVGHLQKFPRRVQWEGRSLLVALGDMLDEMQRVVGALGAEEATRQIQVLVESSESRVLRISDVPGADSCSDPSHDHTDEEFIPLNIDLEPFMGIKDAEQLRHEVYREKQKVARLSNSLRLLVPEANSQPGH